MAEVSGDGALQGGGHRHPLRYVRPRFDLMPETWPSETSDGALGVGGPCRLRLCGPTGVHDYDPERDGDEQAWAAALAAQGWRPWDAGAGPSITLEGRRLRRWSLRREASTPAGADKRLT